MSLYRGWAPRCYIGKHILLHFNGASYCFKEL